MVIRKSFLHKIEEIIGFKIISCVKVEGGRSFKPKYKMVDNNGLQYLVKQLTYQWSDNQIEFCSYLYEQEANIAKPIAIFEDESIFAIFEWVNGYELHFANDTPHDNTIEMGYLAASSIKSIHNVKIISGYERPDMRYEIEYYIQAIKEKNIVFPYMDTIISGLQKEAISLLNNHKKAYVHMDFHCGNMIYVPTTDKIILIDYESITISNPWRDFCYAVLFHENTEHLFWYTVIFEYFKYKIPCEFWIESRIYCTVQFLRMLIHEWEKCHSNYLFMAEKMANTIYKNFYGCKSLYPHWVDKYISNSDTIRFIISSIEKPCVKTD